MDRLPLDELPQHTEWAASLLDPNRDFPSNPDAYTDAEAYDDIYTDMLEQYLEDPTDREQFALIAKDAGRDDPDVISVNEQCYLASSAELLAREQTAVRNTLETVIGGGEAVVCLGCGWGATLGVIVDAFPDVSVVGGELAERGVELARELHAEPHRYYPVISRGDLIHSCGRYRSSRC